ncbi:MAG TPA: ABC transporter permease [Vicinamibacterales bacterium]|nr:ABC transporter permease [Vicinamibacterales bacterium]
MRTWLSRIVDVVLRRSREARLDAEVETHLALLADEHVRRGLSPADAHLAARKAFGGVDQMKERYRDQRGLPFFDTLAQDVKFSIRLMRKNTVFSLTAAGSLALSIAALTMAFSIVNAFVFKPLPIRDPASVYFTGWWSYPDYRDLTERLDAKLVGYRISMMSVGVEPDTSILWGYLATGNYFDELGITPAAGRFFTPAEDVAPGGSPYAVISYDSWQTRFGGRADVVGTVVPINGRPFTILGVAPQGFHGTEVFYRPEVWVPMTMQAEIEVGSSWLTTRQTMNVMVLARLTEGVSRTAAEAQMRTVVAKLSSEHPRNGALNIRLTRPGMFGDTLGPAARAFAWGIFGLGVVLMLAGCSNLAGLLLARGNDRAREIVLRTAIGAGRMRIARQLLTESILLAICGGVGGAILAWIGTRAISAWRLPVELPTQLDLRADTMLLLFAIAASVTIGVLVGIAPARFAMRLDLNASLKGHADLAVGRRRFQGRDVLVAVQVALCVVLLHACFLAVRGLQRASTASLGWNPSHLVMAATELGLARYSRDQFHAYVDRARDEARRLPGIEAVSVANSLPLHIDQSNTTIYALPATEPPVVTSASFYSVSPGYFGTLQIPLRQGRDFTEFDTFESPAVAVVNRTLAERLFPGRDAVGQQISNGRGRAISIVGIVDSGKYVAIGESPRAAIFFPQKQFYSTSSMLIARVAPGSGVTPQHLSAVIQEIDRDLPIRTTATGAQLTAYPLLPYRAGVIALGLLGAIASGLLLSGLHSLLAYAVIKRRREIGIRMALGADRSSVVRAVMMRVLGILALGAGAGAMLTIGTGPLISSMALGVPPREPRLIVAIVILLASIALISCAGPVRRSLRVDPLIALREE